MAAEAASPFLSIVFKLAEAKHEKSLLFLLIPRRLVTRRYPQTFFFSIFLFLIKKKKVFNKSVSTTLIVMCQQSLEEVRLGP